jgi:hypothetical protein
MRTINRVKENKKIVKEWVKNNRKIKNRFRITIIDNKILIFDVFYNDKKSKVVIRYFNFIFKKLNIKYGSRLFFYYADLKRFYVYLDEINHYQVQIILKSIEKAGRYLGIK